MTIIRPSNVRVFFDNKLCGDASLPEVSQLGPDTFGISDEVISAKPGVHTGTFTLDLESQAAFYAWGMRAMQVEAAERINKLAGRCAPFEFYPPILYHGDMMRNESDRRFMVVRPSNVGKTEASLALYAGRLMRNEAWDRRWRSTFDKPRMPNKRHIPSIVELLCKNWEENK